MLNLDTLDTLIAIVITLLVLSLIVQSLQSLIKKLFKLKSRQLEESLIDLFENVLEETPQTADRLRIPTLRLFTKHPSKKTSPEVRAVYDAVQREFKEIGRVSARGKWMLDSISKEDLMKVLRKIAPDSLMPDTIKNLQATYAQLTTLKTAIANVQTGLLSGESSAKFAKMQETLAPLVNDIDSLFKGGTLGANVLLADILNLRELKLGEVFDLLGEVQKTVASNLAAAQAGGASGTATTAALTTLDASLKSVAAALTGLRQQADAALAPLRLKLTEVENWYDTVMQSFEERYNRGMKTYAFVLGLCVAVWLNANIFSIYEDISTNELQRNAIVQSRGDVLKLYEQQLAVARLDDDVTPIPTPPQPQATPQPTPEVETALTPQPTPQAATAEAGKQANEKRRNDLKKLVDDTRAEMKKEAAQYTGFGFKPLAQEFKTIDERVAQGAAGYAGKRPLMLKAGYMLTSIPGWLLTAALLSLGAPFWHDALESLFGVKNLLRKKGDIKNVEQGAGQGQPKP